MPRKVELSGSKIGRWTVIAEDPVRRNGKCCWLCRCDCGNESSVVGQSLSNGASVSCGCYMIECVKSHGLSGHELYSIWHSMIRRCYDDKCASFPNYGSRGISVCKRWQDVRNFIKDMHPRPFASAQIDRSNNDKNYSPGNCRWVTSTENNRNRSSNKVLEHAGKKMCVVEWSEETGIPASAIYKRLQYGFSVEDTLTAPLHSISRQS